MSLKQRADALLSAAANAGDVPGVLALATDRNGPIYEGAFGSRVLGGTAMTTDTVVWIASMTKAVTGAAAMQLVEQGRIDLDEPASRFVPYLAEVQVLEGWTADGKPKMRAPKRPVTLRHLLTHSAGFSYEIWNPDILRYQEVMGIPMITGCENAALRTPLVFDPGESWDYGINIDFAGKIVEAISGKKLGAYLHDNLFVPLGMSSTAFKITPDMRVRLAKIHQRGDDDQFTALDLEIPQEPEFEMGGGGLYSTVGDYGRFVRMILNRGKANGNKVLKPETVDLMSRNNMGANRVKLLPTAMPPLSNDAEFFPGVPKSWGLSFQINEEPVAQTGRPAGTLMWAGLANSYYWIDHKNGIGGVYATQILPFADRKSLPLYYAFERAVYS